MKRKKIKIPIKNCYRCFYIENIGNTTDIFKCNFGIFDKFNGRKGLDFLCCPYFTNDKEDIITKSKLFLFSF